MRLYRVVGRTNDPDGSDKLRWAGSMAEVRQEAKKLMETMAIKRSAVDHAEVDVPTDKQGLLKFLNEL